MLAVTCAVPRPDMGPLSQRAACACPPGRRSALRRPTHAPGACGATIQAVTRGRVRRPCFAVAGTGVGCGALGAQRLRLAKRRALTHAARQCTLFGRQGDLRDLGRQRADPA